MGGKKEEWEERRKETKEGSHRRKEGRELKNKLMTKEEVKTN